MSKFKVGDKVAIYCGRNRTVGEIEAIESDGNIAIKDDSLIYHQKQCRKIVRKEPKYYWVDDTALIDADEAGITEDYKKFYVKVKIVKDK